MAQFLRPDGNVTTTNFTNGFSNIDEATASDVDFAYGANNVVAVLEVSLSNPSATPGSGTSTVRYRIARTNAGTVDGTGSAVTVTCAVVQGTTVLASDSAQTATGTWTQYSFNPDMSGVTDWNDVRLRFTTSASGGSPANRRGAAVSWAELEAPDAAASQSLTPTLFTNTQTFFDPTVTSLWIIAPSLFTNTQTFFDPTVTPGAVTLTPSLFTNSQTFFGPTVGTGGATQDLFPTLVTNAQSFFTPSVTATKTLLPSLVTNTQTFFGPAITTTYGLTPSLVTNSQSFFSPTVTTTYGLTAPLVTNVQTFYGPEVTLVIASNQTLSQDETFINANEFFSPIITVEELIRPSPIREFDIGRPFIKRTIIRYK